MRKIVLFLSILLIVSACSEKNGIPKPAKPIDAAVMENILYDLALLQALKSYSPEKLTQNNINSATYIYQKYKIDSLQLAENNKYFASDMEQYNLMFNRVNERLQNQKKEMDSLLKKEKKDQVREIKDIGDSMSEMEKKQRKPRKSRILARG
jgi:hypothetical protein